MFSKKESSSNIWMSFTDLLISSLIVFILISVVSTYNFNKKTKELTETTRRYDEVDILSGQNLDFGFSQEDINNLDGVTLTEDGKIRFTNFELFTSSSHQLSSALKDKLEIIWPIVLEKISSIKDHNSDIWEIRIEGHTDSRPYNDTSGLGNLGLSQRRAAQTWIFINNNLMNDTSNSEKKYVSDRIVTLGFGDKKLLNNNGLLLKNNGGIENQDLSRRIEISLLSRPSSVKQE